MNTTPTLHDEEEILSSSDTREPVDPPTPEDNLREARDFHDEWSRRNPYSVYGQSTIWH